MKKILLILLFIFSQKLFANSEPVDISKVESKQQIFWQMEDKIGATLKKYPEHNFCPIYDGIFDVNTFSINRCRIMWILKEGYDDKDKTGNPSGGGWGILEGKNGSLGKPSNTWMKIMQFSYAVQNKMYKYQDLPEIPKTVLNDSDYGKSIRSCVYLNTNKMPGPTQSSDYSIQQNFYIWKDVLKEQISFYKPYTDIVIFGGTYKFYQYSFYDLFGFKPPYDTELQSYITKRGKKIVYGAFVDSENRLYISAQHPATGHATPEEYFDTLIAAIKDWEKGKLKSFTVKKTFNEN